MDMMRICLYATTAILLAGPFAVQLQEDTCIKNYSNCSKNADATLQNRLYFADSMDQFKVAFDEYVIQMDHCVDDLENCNNDK